MTASGRSRTSRTGCAATAGARLRDGAFFDTAAYLFFEFELDGDKPNGFVVRWASNDAVIGNGAPVLN